MEGNETKTVYFIYAQNGVKNNIAKVNLINKIKDAKEISKEIFGNTIRILYAIKISKNKNENKISISLKDNQGDTYISNIPLNLLEQLEEEEGDIEINNIILFKLRFVPLNNDQIDKLDQIILPYDQQFTILENQFKEFKNNNEIMISLYLNVISQIFLKSKQKYDFILQFFLKIYEKLKGLPQLKIVMKYFFQNIKNILRNCDSVQLTIPKEQLKILNGIDKIRTDLIKIINAQKSEENVDIFLSYYYIHFENKLFIKFINNEKYKNKINITLISNRNLFNNFNTEIITPSLMDEAENTDELITLMMLYPNIVECFHILISENFQIAHKLILLKQIENKSVNILTIQKPKKSDNMNLLKEYFTRSMDFLSVEHMYPFKIQENFFHEYLKLFEDNDEEFHNIIIIIEMLRLYNKNSIKKINTEQVINSFYKKGFYLLKNKKLKNLEFIKFLETVPDILNNNKEIFDYFPIGIEFNEEKYGNDEKFLNHMLNEDKYKLREYLGQSYADIFEKIFEKFVMPKDLLNLKKWEISLETPQDILEIFLKTIKRIWINYPENKMHGLETLFSQEFAMASNKVKNYKYFIDLIEEKISKEKLMAIYSQILLKKYNINDNFKKHIKDYIRNYNNFTPMYIWYLMTTEQDDIDKKLEILHKHLDFNGEEYAVKYTDYAHYPDIVEERINLFTDLKQYGFIPKYFKDSVYYKKSMNSKNEITKNIFKDAVIMHSNIEKIQILIEHYFTKNNNEEIYFLLFDFGDKVVAAKKYYDSLKKVENYWTTFFPKDKKEELTRLQKLIIEFENTKLDDCANEKLFDKSFNNYLPEAEKGNKLQESIIFMELYDIYKNINDERLRFNICFKKFKELEDLRKNFKFNSLGNELKDAIINAAYKNENLLNEELNFIEDYFDFNENDNLDMKILKNSIIDSVKVKQNYFGRYINNLDEKFGPEDDINNEAINLKNEIKLLYEKFIHYSKIIENNNDRDIENISKSFFDFYSKLFTKAEVLGKLSLKSIYVNIILLSETIFYVAKNLEIIDINHKEFLLISEFNFIIQVFNFYQKISKNNYISIFKVFADLYNYDLKENSLNNLIEIVKSNIPKYSLNNILVNILEYEKKKNEGKEIIAFIFDDDRSYLYKDLIPIIDLIFSEEITKKLSFKYLRDDNFIEFNSSVFQEVNNTCKKNENNLAETVLFYFENKIMTEFKKMKFKEKDFFENDNFKECFKICFKFLEKEYNNKSKILSKLFSIAFIKCFSYNIINFVNLNEELLQECDDFFKNVINFDNKNSSSYRMSLQLYLLKLIFKSSENFQEYTEQLQKLNIDNDDIKEQFYEHYKNCGFNALFIPIQKDKEDKNYKLIISKLFKLSSKDIINDNAIKEAINNDVDLLFCIMTNFCFSFYYNKNYFGTEENIEIKKWFISGLEKIEFLKKNELIKNIFTFFINIEKNHDLVYKEYNLFSCEQILSLLIAARFVLAIISSGDRDNLFYNLLNNAKNTIENNSIFFNKYYLKEFDINIADKRNITCLTFKVINFIILSHLFFGFKIKKITIKDMETIPIINSLKNKSEKNISDFILDNLFKEFGDINNNLVPLLGINNIVIFMNTLYKNLMPKIIEMKCDKTEDYIKANEQLIDVNIESVILNYRKSVDDYYLYQDKINNNIKNEININNEGLIDILLESPNFYNNNKVFRDKYNLLSYFTYTNFSLLNEDFRNQYIYYYWDSTNYPLISSFISNENNIFNIINYLPKLNELSNKVYDKFNMKCKRNDINNKKIEEIFNDDINAFNNFIRNNNELFNINKQITKNSNISEIINFPGSTINLVYTKIIKIYNNFLEKMKMKIGINIKKNIGSVIIQEAKENDYNFNDALINENKVSIKEKLDELILLYSKRERKKGNDINVYDGGKINYNLDAIENKLEEIFISSKKYFKEQQKMFLFYEDIFENDAKILNEIKNKFKQKEINEQGKEKMEEFLKEIAERDKRNMLTLFYELFSLLNKLTQMELNDLRIKNDENDFGNLIKYMKLNTYNFALLNEVKDSLKNILSFNSLIYFYEKVIIKAFNDLTSELKQKIVNELDNEFNINEDIRDEIDTCLNYNKVIKKEIFLEAMKKYILKFIMKRDNYLFKFSDLKEKDFWNKKIYDREDFREDFAKLSKIGEQNVIKYGYLLIYEIEVNDIGKSNQGDNDYADENLD